MNVNELERGDVVQALRHLDPEGANVRPGTVGVVFERTNAYGDKGGPMVRWMNMGACNVYDGDVACISGQWATGVQVREVVEQVSFKEALQHLRRTVLVDHGNSPGGVAPTDAEEATEKAEPDLEAYVEKVGNLTMLFLNRGDGILGVQLTEDKIASRNIRDLFAELNAGPNNPASAGELEGAMLRWADRMATTTGAGHLVLEHGCIVWKSGEDTTPDVGRSHLGGHKLAEIDVDAIRAASHNLHAQGGFAPALTNEDATQEVINEEALEALEEVLADERAEEERAEATREVMEEEAHAEEFGPDGNEI